MVSKTLKQRFEAKYIKDNSGCWLWTASVGSHGYGQLYYKDHEIPIPSHQVAWLLHRGEIPKGLSVLHKCNNKLCVNPNHLYLGTDLDNTHDKITAGTMYYGDHLRKLSEDQIQEIRNLKGKKKQWEIARMFGISQPNVSRILSYTTWK
jgi:hypothetical protein